MNNLIGRFDHWIFWELLIFVEQFLTYRQQLIWVMLMRVFSVKPKQILHNWNNCVWFFLQVLMGGGRRFFLSENKTDPELNYTSYYQRKDLDLVDVINLRLISRIRKKWKMNHFCQFSFIISAQLALTMLIAKAFNDILRHCKFLCRFMVDFLLSCFNLIDRSGWGGNRKKTLPIVTYGTTWDLTPLIHGPRITY